MENNNGNGVLAFVYGSIFIMIAIYYALANYEPPERNLKEYTIYLDGEEVDSEKINVSLYKVVYNDDEKIVYATHK